MTGPSAARMPSLFMTPEGFYSSDAGVGGNKNAAGVIPTNFASFSIMSRVGFCLPALKAAEETLTHATFPCKLRLGHFVFLTIRCDVLAHTLHNKNPLFFMGFIIVPHSCHAATFGHSPNFARYFSGSALYSSYCFYIHRPQGRYPAARAVFSSAKKTLTCS